MSNTSIEQEIGDDHHNFHQVDDTHFLTQVKDSGENPMLSPNKEEEIMKKKYGGMLPKKKSLISKDHEHAFFDSADWALGKQGQGPQKLKPPAEALRPKLQPTVTRQQQLRSRRSSYAPADHFVCDSEPDGGGVGGDHIHINASSEDEHMSLLLVTADDNNTPTPTDAVAQNQSCPVCLHFL